MKLVKLDAKYEGTCLECGEQDLRRTETVAGETFIWCPDCMMGHIRRSPKSLLDCRSMDMFEEQRMAIFAIRRQELQQLREDAAYFKDALETIRTMIVEQHQGTFDVLQEVCEALGLDYYDEMGKLQ